MPTPIIDGKMVCELKTLSSLCFNSALLSSISFNCGQKINEILNCLGIFLRRNNMHVLLFRDGFVLAEPQFSIGDIFRPQFSIGLLFSHAQRLS
jgi:hypothetical protein